MTKLTYDTLEAAGQNFAVLDLIPDTHAWVKNSAGRFVYGNRLFFERFGFRSLAGLMGKSDYDIAPQTLAERYCSDDTQVLRGDTITDRLELILRENLSGDWFLTSKWPIYKPRGGIIGTLGISRHLNKTDGTATPYRDLQAPIDYICQHFGNKISVESLASACNISVSALERRFKKHLKRTPHQYINEVRLDNARQMLLETDKSIGSIALESGFADHSHFTRSYNRHYSVTPSEQRRTKGSV
jgi:AraC-like DNA-binding protein